MVTLIMMTVMGTLTSVMMTGPHDHPLPPHLLRSVRLDDRIWLLSQAGGARVGQVGSIVNLLNLVIFSTGNDNFSSLPPFIRYYVNNFCPVCCRIKRRKKKEKLEKILTSEWIKTHSKDDITDVSVNKI